MVSVSMAAIIRPGEPPWESGTTLSGPRAPGGRPVSAPPRPCHAGVITATDRAPTDQRRRLLRRGEGAPVAGVCAGLAEHLRVDPLVVRLVFGLLTLTDGIGVVAYAAFWVVVPLDPRGSPPGRSWTRTPAGVRQFASVAALVAGAVLLLHATGLWFSGTVLWPLLVGGTGVALLWVQADEVTRRRWYRLIRPESAAGTFLERHLGLVRLGAGAVLVAAGLTGFLAANEQLQAAREGFVAILAVLVGVALVSGPWLWRLVHDLADERRERIRSQERAELAARVHDSVLQTLTLIQRRAESPREVARLARGQERELRRWLYGDPAGEGGGRFMPAVVQAAAEVEDDHDVRIEVVTVGDATLDERTTAVVLAAREAMVNAAKFSGEERIDVYAEVADGELAVFVRDTGAGFDPTVVPDDRRGIADSIVGRLARIGGRAAVRSERGGGTEVEIIVEGVQGGG